MKCAKHPRRLRYHTAAETLGRGRHVFVWVIPRKFIGSSGLRHPDQLSVVDHAWGLRTHRRSPVIPYHCGSERRWGGEARPVVYPVCCGINVHHARLTACLRCLGGNGHVTQDVRELATTYSVLSALTE
jgi:hypothetical protein